MIQNFQSESFEIELIQGYFFEFKIQPLTISFRKPFGTAHSVSTKRVNAEYELKIKKHDDVFKGRGESGLPPKKAKCYLADYNDCLEFFVQFKERVQDLKEGKIKFGDENHIFSDLSNPKRFFLLKEDKSILGKVLKQLLCILDLFGDQVNKIQRAFKSGMVASILEASCQYLKISFQELLGEKDSESQISFYTVGMMETIEEMIENGIYGLQFTPYIKIKLDEDIQKGIKIVETFYEQKLGVQIGIDANSSWGLEKTKQFLNFVQNKEKNFQNYINMVEQPFDLEYTPGENSELDQEWTQIKENFLQIGVQFYADESISDFKDILKLQKQISGANIKLEKIGGILEAVKAVEKTREIQLKVWIGEMVVSPLGNSIAAQLLVLGDWGDLDGSLLVNPMKYSGGIEWQNGKIKYFSDKIGFGVDLELEK